MTPTIVKSCEVLFEIFIFFMCVRLKIGVYNIKEPN